MNRPDAAGDGGQTSSSSPTLSSWDSSSCIYTITTSEPETSSSGAPFSSSSYNVFTTAATTEQNYNSQYCAILSVDEFGPIEVKPQKGSNWAKEKHPDRVPATYNRDQGVRHLLAAYDLVKDKMYGHIKKHKTNVEFLAFLKYVRTLYPLYFTLFIILDNFSPHIVDRVAKYAITHNIRFAFTPTNASWLDPIEPHFGPLRMFAISNCNPKNHEEIGTNIRKYLAWRNRHHQQPAKQRRKKGQGREAPSEREVWDRDFVTALAAHLGIVGPLDPIGPGAGSG